MPMKYVIKSLPLREQVQTFVQGAPQVRAVDWLRLAGSRELTRMGVLLVPPSLQYTPELWPWL